MSKIHFVKWIDSHGGGGWMSQDCDFKPDLIDTVGWLVKETENALTLTSSLSSTTDHILDPITIPIACIHERYVIDVE